ncbi:MAG: hypothetical protein EXR89_02790 [Methylococcaceae bacterium]|nr:hypothetical protein [Methylococcaceae bacterium]
MTQLLSTEKNLELITTIKKNMKSRALEAFDELILRKSNVIKTLNDQFKNIFNLEHPYHNFAVNVVSCLVAYSYQEKKPSLNIRSKDLLTKSLNSYFELRLSSMSMDLITFIGNKKPAKS